MTELEMDSVITELNLYFPNSDVADLEIVKRYIKKLNCDVEIVLNAIYESAQNSNYKTVQRKDLIECIQKNLKKAGRGFSLIPVIFQCIETKEYTQVQVENTTIEIFERCCSKAHEAINRQRKGTWARNDGLDIHKARKERLDFIDKNCLFS